MSLSQTISPTIEAEREELEWLLTSGLLGRSQNLIRMLKFICEEHFEGRDEGIKEYTIAVEALGRRPDFDSQVDTIVRVTAHALRKRLLEVYQNEGAAHPIRIVIPPGHYAPSFLHNRKHAALDPAYPFEGANPPGETISPPGTPQESEADLKPSDRTSTTPWRNGAWLLLLIVALAAIALYLYNRQIFPQTLSSLKAHQRALPAASDTIRALMGGARQPYIDHSGNRWTSGDYCSNGVDVRVPDQKIGGTEDSYLYLAGTRGISHCIFPVKPGMYELHVHFAETSDLPAATQVATVFINASLNIGVDVVDIAGGDGIATSRVVTGIYPENDGAIHLDYISEISPLNAVEILPSTSDKLLPVRIVAASEPFTDSLGQRWLSDRYFTGGRRGLLPDRSKLPDLGAFESDRVGNFRYSIPVVPLQARYRVTLFFREPWFGKENRGIGGPGSRVFDIASNGSMLLKDFDIMAEGGNRPVVKTFENVQGSSLGRIDLSFMSVVNYPLVNAIEVIPEPFEIRGEAGCRFTSQRVADSACGHNFINNLYSSLRAFYSISAQEDSPRIKVHACLSLYLIDKNPNPCHEFEPARRVPERLCSLNFPPQKNLAIDTARDRPGNILSSTRRGLHSSRLASARQKLWIAVRFVQSRHLHPYGPVKVTVA